MPRTVVGIALLALMLAGRPATGDVVPLEVALAEKVMGRADAPVTVIEYASLTCSYCASFHRDTLPKIKEAYIDTGKVRLVYRDFPLDTLALAAAMIARCGGEDRYFGFLEVLFRSQETWTRAKDPRQELERIARFGGMSIKDFGACLDNEALMKAIRERARVAETETGIGSTPTFMVNGRKVAGALSFDEFRSILDDALAKK